MGTIRARPVPLDATSWQLIPQDRHAAGWLKRHAPRLSLRQQTGYPFPATIVAGSDLIPLLALARASRITLTER